MLSLEAGNEQHIAGSESHGFIHCLTFSKAWPRTIIIQIHLPAVTLERQHLLARCDVVKRSELIEPR